MRITQNATYSRYISDIMRKQVSLYDLNVQLSTGKKINRPSDDPIKTKDILLSRTALADLDQYEKNIDYGLTYLSSTEDVLNSVKESIVMIKEVATTAATGTYDVTARRNSATVVQNLFQHLVDLGNSVSEDRYMFSGYEVATTAFDASGNYQGDTNKLTIKIGASSSAVIGVNGGEVFKGTGITGGVDVFQTITDLVTALNSDGQAGIVSSIGSLENAFNQVSNSVSEIGGKINRLTTAKTDMAATKLDLKTTISNLEDADITTVISDLNLQQTALEASMSAAGKVFKLNIFDYL